VATEVLKALGEYANSNLNTLGGFSFRNHTGEILAILPDTNFQEAKQLAEDFGRGFQEEKLANIQALTTSRSVQTPVSKSSFMQALRKLASMRILT